MTTSIKAIQTRYKGHLFRSRLEARWAVVLDALGVKWHYEAEGYDLGSGLGYYLPDFWLPELNTFLEIKAETHTKQELEKIRTLAYDKLAYFSFGYSLNAESKHSLHYMPTEYGSLAPLLSWPKEFKDKQAPIASGFYQKQVNGVLRTVLPANLDGELYCPVCHSSKPNDSEFYGVHVEAPRVLEPQDDYAHPLLRARGPIYCLSAWSENCSHQWEYIFGFHKGSSFFGCGIEYEFNFTPLGYLLYIKEQGASAIQAGRTARFEHGANGAVL